MKKVSFEYGPIARGCYHALIVSAVFIFVLVPSFFVYYILLLVFLGFGLKYFLIQTEVYTQWQFLLAKLDKRKNEQMYLGFRKRKAKEITKRDDHLETMRQKMMPKDK